MGDMAETFNAMRDATKQHRAAMLAKADTTGWTKHTEWHFSRVFNGKRMDWWPSGGKAMFDGRMVYGHRKVNTLIAKHISLVPNAELTGAQRPALDLADEPDASQAVERPSRTTG